MGKRKNTTPDDIDYLFERDIIDEEDYVEFWQEYWKRDAKGRKDLVQEFIERAGEQGSDASLGVVYRSYNDAKRQKEALEDMGASRYYVARRTAQGKFSKRGTYFQAIRIGKKK